MLLLRKAIALINDGWYKSMPVLMKYNEIQVHFIDAASTGRSSFLMSKYFTL